jgi:hypothetical protein
MCDRAIDRRTTPEAWMKTKNTAWTTDEDTLLAQAARDKISPARLSVRLRRSEGSIKRRMRELGLAGKKRAASGDIRVELDLTVQATRWLESCRSGDLTELMEFYDPGATLECGCMGTAVYAGAAAISEYWAPRLRVAGPDAFALREIRSENGRIVIEYTSYETMPVRMYMSFDGIGKIVRSECGPSGCKSPSRFQS